MYDAALIPGSLMRPSPSVTLTTHVVPLRTGLVSRKAVVNGKRPAAAWAVTGDGALATAFLFQCSAAATPIFLRGCFAA